MSKETKHVKRDLQKSPTKETFERDLYLIKKKRQRQTGSESQGVSSVGLFCRSLLQFSCRYMHLLRRSHLTDVKRNLQKRPTKETLKRELYLIRGRLDWCGVVQIRLDQIRLGQIRSDQIRLNQSRLEQIRVDLTKLNQIRLDQIRLDSRQATPTNRSQQSARVFCRSLLKIISLFQLICRTSGMTNKQVQLDSHWGSVVKYTANSLLIPYGVQHQHIYTPQVSFDKGQKRPTKETLERCQQICY